MESIPRSEIEQYVERVRPNLNNNPDMKEADMEFKVVQQFFSLLGWPVSEYDSKGDVKARHNVKVGDGHKEVDHALIIADSPRVFVEVKRPNKPLTDGDWDQLKSYMRVDDVQWGILTNGLEYHVYGQKRSTGERGEYCLGELQLDDLPENQTVLSAISYQSLLSGQSTTFAEQYESLEYAYDAINNNIQNIREDISETILQHTEGAAEDIITEQSEQFVSDITDLIDPNDFTPLNLEDGTSPSTGDEVFELMKQEADFQVTDRKLSPTGDTTQADCFREAARALFRHGFLTIDDLPVTVGDGVSHLLNAKTEHDDGREMRQGSEIMEGVYMEMNHSGESKVRELRRLAAYVCKDS